MSLPSAYKQTHSMATVIINNNFINIHKQCRSFRFVHVKCRTIPTGSMLNDRIEVHIQSTHTMTSNVLGAFDDLSLGLTYASTRPLGFLIFKYAMYSLVSAFNSIINSSCPNHLPAMDRQSKVPIVTIKPCPCASTHLPLQPGVEHRPLHPWKVRCREREPCCCC